MINLYLIAEVARLEHEERVRSLTPIPDFGGLMITNEPGWVSQLARRLLAPLGKRLAGLGERMKRGREVAPDARHAEVER